MKVYKSKMFLSFDQEKADLIEFLKALTDTSVVGSTN
jgi:hypothetical protein